MADIIDACCGLGRWSTRRPPVPFAPEEILALLDHCGIAAALVYANLAAARGWYQDANATLLELIDGEPRFLPAFVMAPDPDDGRLQAHFDLMREHGGRAVWLLPQGPAQAHAVAPWLLAPILRRCVAARLPVLLAKDQITGEDVRQLCLAEPELRLILSGASYLDNTWLFPLLDACPQLRVCLGQFYIPATGPEDLVRRFGAERLIFGSGLPHFAPGGLLGHVHYAPLSQAEKDLILGGNLRRLLDEVAW